MKLLRRQLCMLYVIVCVLISYLAIHKTKVQRYTQAVIRDHPQTRINFLNNTFCGKFISGTWEKFINESEIMQRNLLLQSQINDSQIVYKNLTCTEFISKNGFYSKHITDLEYKNPMAFSVLVYKNLYQFQVFMRTLYTRSNFHCIHVDQEASIDLYLYAMKLSECLDNIYIVHPRLEIGWGTMTILEVERQCQTYLLKQSSAWHYYMTVSGTELPIQTNLNRIQILQLVPDKSRIDVSSFPPPQNMQASKTTPPPDNMTVYKGEFHSILTREFIQAVHTNPLALEFWSFLNGTVVPDEYFYPSLVRLPQLPGGKSRVVPAYYHYQLLSHYKVWDDDTTRICRSGVFHNTVCQFNYKDLSNIERGGRLFANKFNQELDVVSIDCWEQWLQMKQIYHQDIDPRNYIDKYPFIQRKSRLNDNQTTTNTTKLLK